MPNSQPSNAVTVIVGDDAYWEKAVERMTELTRAGTLKWDVVDATEAQVSSAGEVIAAYDARYDNKIVRFLEAEPPLPMPRSAAAMLHAATQAQAAMLHAATQPSALYSLSGAPARKRQSVYSLALIDVNGAPLFAFPKNVELIELLAAIKYQIAGIESFVNALFAAA